MCFGMALNEQETFEVNYFVQQKSIKNVYITSYKHKNYHSY